MLSTTIILNDEIFIIITSDSGIRLVYLRSQLVISNVQVVLASAIRQEKQAIRPEKDATEWLFRKCCLHKTLNAFFFFFKPL